MVTLYRTSIALELCKLNEVSTTLNAKGLQYLLLSEVHCYNTSSIILYQLMEKKAEKDYFLFQISLIPYLLINN